MQPNLTPDRAYPFEDFTGKTFGQLLVVSFSHKQETGTPYRRYWNCICIDCGTQRIVRSDNIKEGPLCLRCKTAERHEAIRAKTTKQCSVCKKILSKERFNIDHQRVDGLHGRCKDCTVSISTKQRKIKKIRTPIEVLLLIPDQKRCCKCRIVKPKSDFWRNVQSADGIHTRCKPCLREDQNKHKFGLAEGAVESMLQLQNHRCPICLKKLTDGRGRAIDHCHESGKVRGLLCPKCNAGLGFFDDSPELLRAAASYMDQHVGLKATQTT